MKPLPTKFQKWGETFTQVKRDGDVAIYCRRKPGNRNLQFEAIIIQKHNGREVFGRHFEPAEFYPSSEQFGRQAFACVDMNRAEACFRELKERQIRLNSKRHAYDGAALASSEGEDSGGAVLNGPTASL